MKIRFRTIFFILVVLTMVIIAMPHVLAANYTGSCREFTGILGPCPPEELKAYVMGRAWGQTFPFLTAIVITWIVTLGFWVTSRKWPDPDELPIESIILIVIISGSLTCMLICGLMVLGPMI